MPNKIEHLVVLMMENRSFDHMFGFLKSTDWPIDGLDGNESNSDSQGNAVRVSPDARDAGDFSPDPGHDFFSVNQQIFGNVAGSGEPNMEGFVKAYETKTNNVQKSHNVMKCFAPGRLPVLFTLAQQYAVCDRWFASVPGPTLPNRAFAFGATSLGRVDMTPNYLKLKTIFEVLDANSVSSKIYFTDATIGIGVGFIAQRQTKFLFSFDDFVSDCKKNKLPAFSFVEPRYTEFSSPGSFFGPSDQHPDHNMRLGERVINAVYEAVTSNAQTWESTLLLITYDEHGGLYDHVPPPETVSPGDKPVDETIFDFKRLGVRVPAVLVSPFIESGTIIHDKVFDHCSIVATARKLFLSEPEKFALNERDRQANTFEDCLNLDTPRVGKVKIPKAIDPPAPMDALGLSADAADVTETAGAASSSLNSLNDFQQAMLFQAFQADSRILPGPTIATQFDSITTENEAARYFLEVRKNIEASRAQAEALNGSNSAGTKKKAKAKKRSAKKPATKSRKATKKPRTRKRR